MIDERYTLEQLITGFFVKYNRLVDLTHQTYTSYSEMYCTKINLFIDLNSVLKSLYSIDAWGYKSVNRYEMASMILNMCGHYRQFYRNIGVSSNIYLIYGLNCPKSNETYVLGYNDKFVRAYMKKPSVTNIIEDNMAILKLITQYIPKVYFFDIGRCEVSSMISHIIKTSEASKHGYENIILSKDILMLQLIPEYNVRVLRPLKTKDGDESFIVDNKNLWSMYFSKYRHLKSAAPNIPTQFISNIMAMTGVQERGLATIFNIHKAMKLIGLSLENGFLPSNQFCSQAVVNTALAVMDVAGYNPVELDMRYKAISTSFQSMYILLSERPDLAEYWTQMVDLEDVRGLKDIISKYFYNTPIDLDRL